MRVIDDGSAVLVRSPAKLNLLLAIRGRRPDGYHELETVMVKISLFDTLRLSSRTDDVVALQVRQIAVAPSAPVPTGLQNLVVRAAELLRHEARVGFGTDIVLHKRIPAEAGLAGGSGNAAAALMGLNRLWRLNLSHDALQRFAGQLGSDVPFFVSGANAALARGRGERIEPFKLGGPLHVVIVKPPFGLSTAAVYRAFAERCAPSNVRPESMVEALAAGRLGEASRRLHNDLTGAADALCPELRRLRTHLERECRYGGLMTGSGSACFGLCGTAREAATAAARLRASHVGEVFTAMSA